MNKEYAVWQTKIYLFICLWKTLNHLENVAFSFHVKEKMKTEFNQNVSIKQEKQGTGLLMNTEGLDF